MIVGIISKITTLLILPSLNSFDPFDMIVELKSSDGAECSNML